MATMMASPVRDSGVTELTRHLPDLCLAQQMITREEKDLPASELLDLAAGVRG